MRVACEIGSFALAIEEVLATALAALHETRVAAPKRPVGVDRPLACSCSHRGECG
jgi:hypothetical protein